MVIKMSNKKNNQRNNFPFSNEVKLMKDEFKRTIDKMSDDEFLELIFYLSTGFLDEDEFEEAWSEDEGWEDEAAKFYGYNSNDIKYDDSLPF